MKKGIHPKYQEVVFQDTPTGQTFLTRSTAKSKETIDLDGKTYPLIKMDVTSASHPFYTGQKNIGQARGRVEKFKEKYGM